MAAKLRPRVMLPRPVSSLPPAGLKPAAASFSGLLDGRLPTYEEKWSLMTSSKKCLPSSSTRPSRFAPLPLARDEALFGREIANLGDLRNVWCIDAVEATVEV